MPRYIIKLNDGSRDYYLEWSTIVDAPVSKGMSREELRSYIKHLYDLEGLEALDNDRLPRVDAKGTSSILHKDAHETIKYNRAGRAYTKDGELEEVSLSKKEIIEQYCYKKD